MDIIFAVGQEEKIAVIEHPEWTTSNDKAYCRLYEEICAGCPAISKHKLRAGIYRAEYSPLSGIDGIRALRKTTLLPLHKYWEETSCS